MKKNIPAKILLAALFSTMGLLPLSAEDSSDFSDEALFGSPSDDGMFGGGDDDFFMDDGIDELEPAKEDTTGLSKGILFETGSIRIGGSFDMGLEAYTALYDKDSDRNLGEQISHSGISPKADASLFIDARPSQTLRMYTKFGIKYPYKDSVSITGAAGAMQELPPESSTWTTPEWMAYLTANSSSMGGSKLGASITNWLYLKELFTDFSIADRLFFRFGLHTVSWGTGLFFSPVSDMINTSSIDPQNREAQVDGSLNLRTQITFPGTQTCLWLYVVPESKMDTPDTSNLSEDDSLQEYLNGLSFPYSLAHTSFAAKAEFVIGGWELGAGAFYKLHNSPRIMATASGSIINSKVGVFAEAVLRYGSDAQWNEDEDWSGKDLIFQGTIGAMYIWKDPEITFMAQYFFDGNKDDHEYTTKGSSVAATVNFGKIGTKDLTANLFALFYLGKENVTTISDAAQLLQSGTTFMPYAGILSATLKYSPFSCLDLSAGPYITWLDMGKAPVIGLKLGVSLGGGKF